MVRLLEYSITNYNIELTRFSIDFCLLKKNTFVFLGCRSAGWWLLQSSYSISALFDFPLIIKFLFELIAKWEFFHQFTFVDIPFSLVL